MSAPRIVIETNVCSFLIFGLFLVSSRFSFYLSFIYAGPFMILRSTAGAQNQIFPHAFCFILYSINIICLLFFWFSLYYILFFLSASFSKIILFGRNLQIIENTFKKMPTHGKNRRHKFISSFIFSRQAFLNLQRSNFSFIIYSLAGYRLFLFLFFNNCHSPLFIPCFLGP